MNRLAVTALALGVVFAIPALASVEEPIIVDGDTIAIGKERIRLLDVDTPETFRSHCEAELATGLKAKERLRQLLDAGPVSIERSGKLDRYRRTLARVFVNGKDVGDVLVAEGLALIWRPGREAKAERLAHWCAGE